MTAQIQPINLVSPGFLGLNTEQAGSLLSPAYCVVADNAVIDKSNRLASRGGWTDLTTTDITSNPAIETIHEYLQNDGTSATIVAWDGGISNSITDPEGNDISGAVTDTSGRWKFVNFNDNVYGAGNSSIIKYTGSSTFTALATLGGHTPAGILHAGFGRLWSLDTDMQTVYYSGLLSDDFGAASAGSIDMSNVWTDGTDEVTAITAFNGALVVFGRRHIVFWVDGKGSALGLDPTEIYVTDVITGTGCVVDMSIQPVGETDLLFLSPNGVQSIKRLIQEKSNPIVTLTKYVRGELLTDINLADLTQVRSAYSPIDGFYVLTFPDRGVTWCLDQRRRYQDDDGSECSIVTTWTLAPTAWSYHKNGTLYLGTTAGVGDYGTANTDNGTAFRFNYTSPWLDLGEEVADRLKMLKRIGAIVFVRTETNLIFKWAFDFSTTNRTRTETVEGVASAEWGSAEWGLSEWAGGLSLRILKLPARGRGQYISVSLEAEVTAALSLQQMELFTKIGRLA